MLDARQTAAADQVLDEEGARRRHVVVALSGAHAYGFPSPDSDLDLKGVHVAPTRDLVGLSPTVAPAERMEIVDGVEVDYSSNELGAVLLGVLQGNGNYLERLLPLLPMRRSTELDELAPRVKRAMSRRLFRHYRGFSEGQRRELEKAEKRTVKKVLYVLRTALTGTHALLTGEVVPDLRVLAEAHGFPEVRALIARKQEGERVALDDAELEPARALMDRAFAAIEAARGRSVLPEEPDVAELDALLIELRRRYF